MSAADRLAYFPLETSDRRSAVLGGDMRHCVRVEMVTFGHGDRTVTMSNAIVRSDDPYEGGSFDVDLRGPGLSASQSVFVFAFSGLAPFFTEIADQWRGWEGAKVWQSPEGHLTIEATRDAAAHDHFRFTLRDGPIPTWSASVEVEVEAGEEMTRLAGEVEALLPHWGA